MYKPFNSFIRTEDGLSLVISNKPYSVAATHAKYEEILDALRSANWDAIPSLINTAKALEKYAGMCEIFVDAEAGVVTFNGEEVLGTLVEHMISMMEDNFDIDPLVLFLTNLMQNPDPAARLEAYGWMSANGVTITEDGYLLAWKRVQQDYKSFYDGVTDNSIGKTVSLPRANCDSDSTNTCSRGLHFCSQSYLPIYHGGAGRVLMLKINPRDIVSIPTDYNNAKGRACQYEIVGEAEGDARVDIEVKEVLTQPVITAATDVNASNAYKAGYQAGYKDGRGKKAKYTSAQFDVCLHSVASDDQDFEDGYEAGNADGKAKKPKLY